MWLGRCHLKRDPQRLGRCRIRCLTDRHDLAPNNSSLAVMAFLLATPTT